MEFGTKATESVLKTTGSTQQIKIQTPRLLLRGAKSSDLEALHKCFSDPELMKYWSSLPHESTEKTQRLLSSMISNPQNGHTDFIIVLSGTDTAIGKIGIWSGNEIGFMIAREYWRKGLMSEALEALLLYIFEDLNFEAIVADVDPRNEASIGTLKKFGFREIGYRKNTFEIGGVWVDSLDLTLSKECWEVRKSKT